MSAAVRDQSVVFLIDDQPIVGEAVRRLLNVDDVSFHFCSDPSVAVELAARLQPTVILQDLVMPGVDGLEMLAAFRAHPATAETPIIVLSSREEPQTKSDAFASGASDYLVKLPDRIELLARVRYHSSAHIAQLHRNAMAGALAESERKLADRVQELQVTLAELNRVRGDMEAANIRLERESFLDTLTEVLNRRGIEHQLSVEIGRAARQGLPLYAILLDCDGFKGVNDRYGHDSSDMLLREIANRMSGCVRRTDHVARIGGDEFLVILSQATADEAAELGERVRLAIAEAPMALKTTSITQTVSVAVFQVPLAARSTTTVLSHGSALLHTSKRHGKNCVTLSWSAEARVDIVAWA